GPNTPMRIVSSVTPCVWPSVSVPPLSSVSPVSAGASADVPDGAEESGVSAVSPPPQAATSIDMSTATTRNSRRLEYHISVYCQHADCKSSVHGYPLVAMTLQRHQAYEQLKNLILDGELRPGEPMREQQLAERTGTSRTPVREALHELAREGLVRLVPGRGAFVAEISIPDLLELFQLRDVLEPYAARLAARA